MFRRNASGSAKQPLRSAVVMNAGRLQSPTILSTSSRENAAAYAAKNFSTDLRVMLSPIPQSCDRQAVCLPVTFSPRRGNPQVRQIQRDLHAASLTQ
jgi:hypothetical protein